MIFPWEKRFSLEHLSKDAACAPDVHFNIVFLPCKHDLGGAVVSGRNVSGHLRVLNSSKAEIADLEVAILVDEDVARLEVSVNDTSAVDILQTSLVNDVSCLLCFLVAGTHTKI